MTAEERADLQSHLQTAVEIELATIPIYLYSYYSIARIPNVGNLSNGDAVATFANKAGGIIMSVAVEEMLHMSLACNILRALGGQPKIYQHSPWPFPTNLPHHKKGFSVGLEQLSVSQLGKFLQIEKPEKPGSKPQGNNWETIGQFYDYIENFIRKKTSDADFKYGQYQLNDGDGYYSPNNIDTVYPTDANYRLEPINPSDPSERGSDEANYPNSEHSGKLITVNSKKSAIHAIQIIKHQGEGYPDDPKHKFDDPEKDEDSHWFKFHELHKKIKKFGGSRAKSKELQAMLFNFPVNPTTAGYPAPYQPLSNLANAVYSYLLLLTETSFQLRGRAQYAMFYIGMHKGMIFILDKIIGGMRYNQLGLGADSYALAPTFENHTFSSKASAKKELVALAESIPASLNLDPNILPRIKDLPDVNVLPHENVQFA